MDTNTLPNRLPSLGSITGIKLALYPNEPDLTQTGWSIDQLKKYLTNEGDQNFVTREWVMLVNRIIQDHMADTGNPHEVTLDQLSASFVDDVLGRVIPGTPPISEPFYALDPASELPLVDMIPAAHSTTNCLRLNSGQNFQVPANKITTDHLTGKAGWALYGNLSDYLQDNWATSQDTDLNSIVSQVSHPSVAWPFLFWAVAERYTVSQYGLSFPITTQINAVYTVQVLIKSVATGILEMYNKADPTVLARYDLDTKTILFCDPAVTLTIISQIEDFVVVCFSFTAVAAQSVVHMVHKDPEQTVAVRQGQAGRILFLAAKLSVTKTVGFVPIVNDELQPWLAGPLYPDLGKIGTPAYLSEFMVNLHFYLQPGLDNSQTGGVLFKMGLLQIARTAKEWQVQLGGITIQSRPLLEGLNIFTLSYSPSELIVKSLADARRVYQAAYPRLATENAQLGPCNGYLLGFYLYPYADKSRAVEFLTNG